MEDFFRKDWYEQILTHIVDVVSVFDLNLDYVFVSKSVEKFLGYNPEELIGKNAKKVLPEKYYDFSIKLLKEELEKEKYLSDKDRTLTLVMENIRKNGEVILVEINVSALRDEDGYIQYILVVSRDITERVKLQQEIEARERKFRTLFNSTNDAIFLHDAITGKVLDVNEPMLNMYGYNSKEEVIDKDITLFSHDPFKQQLALSFIKKAAKGIPQVFEWEAKKKNGDVFWVEVALTKASCTDRDVVIAVVRDINKRKILEQQLKEQVELFTTLSDTTSTAIAIFDGDNFLYANKAVYEITGYSKNEFLSNSPYFCVHPDYRDIVKQRVKARLTGDKVLPGRYEVKIITKDGKEKWLELTAGRVEYKGKPAIIGSAYDITDFKNTEEQLAHEKEKLSLILRSVQDVIITTDLEGIVTYINKSGIKLLNLRREEIIGKPLHSVFEFRDVNSLSKRENPVLKSIRERTTIEGYNVSLMIKKDNRVIDIEFNASPIKDKKGNISGCVLVIRDVTEKQKFLQAIQNAQKLESLGTLAAGIAHDFNNLLGGIYGFIDLAIMKSKDKSISNYLKKSLQTLERARHLTNQLLTFASGGEPIKKENLLDEFLKDTIQFALSGSPIKANLMIEKDIVCNFDENQMAQVIDNIVINAMDAMNYKGEIDIELRKVFITDFNKGNLPPGEYAEIKIKDRGVGIPKNILDKIFDPFFTTKQKGHGLGLAIAYSIVKKHGGDIVVESKPGKGSTFYIYLPCAKNVASPHVSENSEDSHMDLCGNGTIIVLEDEEVLQELLKDTLTDLGFHVILKSKGEELIEFIQNADEKLKSDVKAIFFDLVIVGGMGGMEVAQKVKEFIDVPFVVMSGYSSAPIISNPEKYGFVASLKKPFKLQDVIKIVKKYIL